MSAALRYLCGDLGGTNARLMLVETQGGLVLPSGKSELTADEEHQTMQQEKILKSKTYRSADYNHLTDVIVVFMKECPPGPKPEVCVLAVAGPVRDNSCHVTNLNWFLKGSHMAETLKMKQVVLLNDFVANGYGLLALDQKSIVPLNKVEAKKREVKSIIGAGTGLGEAFLTWNGKEYDVFPTEGGHASFAPRNTVEFKMQQYFKETDRLATVSVERCVSGSAIPRMYEFFAKEYPQLVNLSVHDEVKKAATPQAVISKYGVAHKDALCADVIDMFVKLYGAEAGDFCLKTLPFGGLYVAGGVAPKILPALQQQNKFVENLISKGRLRPVLEQIPVFVVLEEDLGLLGSRVIGRRVLRKGLQQLTQITSKL